MSHNLGERFSPRAITEEASYDPFLPQFSMTGDPWLSSATSSPGHVSRTLSGSQSMDLSSTDCIRLSRAAASRKTADGIGMERTATNPSPAFTQYSPTVDPSAFWNDAVLDTNIADSNQPAFDLTANQDLLSGFMANTDLQISGTSSQELPGTAFFGDLSNSDFDYDSTYGSLMSPDFSESMAKDYFTTALEQSPKKLARTDTQSSCEKDGGNTACTLSPISRCRLSMDSVHDALKGVDLSSDNGMTCMTLALKILQTLHIPRSVCLHAYVGSTARKSRQPRMVDSVLSMCRNIVPLVSDMLQCECSLNVQVQLIITNICGKLMSWYRALMRRGHHRSHHQPSRSSTVMKRRSNTHDTHMKDQDEDDDDDDNDDDDDDDQTVRVSRQSITIGHYAFDVALEGKVLAELVSSELRHLERLVQDLATRMQESRFGEIFMDKASSSSTSSSSSSSPSLTSRRSETPPCPWTSAAAAAAAGAEESNGFCFPRKASEKRGMRMGQRAAGGNTATTGTTGTTGKLSAFLAEQMRGLRSEISEFTGQ